MKISIYDLLCTLFNALFVLWWLSLRGRFRLDENTRLFLLLKWIYLGFIILSAVAVCVIPFADNAWAQLIKPTLAVFVYTFFVVAVVCLLSALTPQQRQRLIDAYIYGVIASCLFEFAEVTLAQVARFDLIRFVFSRLSVNSPLFAGQVTGYYEWDIFFRGNGFAGMDTQATYIALVIPALIMRLGGKAPLRNYFMLLIAILGLILTMSRTGLLGALVACLAMTAFYVRRFRLVIAVIALTAIPLYYLYTLAPTEVNELAHTRMQIDYSRLAMYSNALHIAADYPLGIGFGQYFVLYQVSGETAMDANLHNSWLQGLVELGFQGFIYRLLFFGCILWMLAKRRSALSRATFAGICGLMAAACVNSAFDTFYSDLFIALFFAVSILELVKESASVNGRRVNQLDRIPWRPVLLRHPLRP